MVNVLEGTEFGRDLARRKLEEGREQGLEQGRTEAMAAVLHAKFGDLDDLQELARALNQGGFEANLERILSGATLEQLRSATAQP